MENTIKRVRSARGLFCREKTRRERPHGPGLSAFKGGQSRLMRPFPGWQPFQLAWCVPSCYYAQKFVHVWNPETPSKGGPFDFTLIFHHFRRDSSVKYNKIIFSATFIFKYFLNTMSTVKKMCFDWFYRRYSQKMLENQLKIKGSPLLFCVSETTRPSKGGPFDFHMIFKCFL